MRVLGLDASTTTIGLAVLENKEDCQPTLIHVEYFKPSKKGDLFERLATVRRFIFDKIQEYQPNQVVMEDIVFFMQGHSTAATISSLAVLNRTVGLAVYDKLGYSPVLLNVLKIRHALKKQKKLPKKEEIPDLVAEILGIEFPYLFNKKKKISPESYDMADAIAAALAHMKINATKKLATSKSKNKSNK